MPKLKKILPKSKGKAPLILLIEILIGLILSASSFLVFIYITEDVLEKEGVFIDTALSHAAYSLRSPVLTGIMHAVSFLGNEFIIITGGIIALFLIVKRHKREATFFFLTVFSGFLLNSLLKYLLKIPRPTIDPLYIEMFYSFPSGHAMNSFIFYGTLAYLTYHLTHNKKISLTVTFLSVILIFLIGFSRIYLGVHYPSDVIGGFLAGFWWLITVILIDKTLIFYKTRSVLK